MSLRKLSLSVLFLGLALMAVAKPASAGFVGSESFAFGTTATNGSDLTATQYSFNAGMQNTMVVSNTGGAFAGIGIMPFVTNYSTTILNLANLGAFSVTNATFGTFTANAGGVGSSIIDQSSTFLDVYILGSYSNLPGNTASTPASFVFSFNTSGGVIAGTAQLTVPPSGTTPEPASIAMLGLGLAGAGVVGYRRRSVK